VRAETEGPSRYAGEVEVTGARPVTFLLSVTYHPGWVVTIDGAPGTVRLVTPYMLAVDVPPGVHRVEFRFRRAWWTWALLGVPVLAAAAARRYFSRITWRPPRHFSASM
jgi:hypothetical protein